MDPWYLSKRVYAAIIMVIVTVASLLGYKLDEAFKGGLMEALTAIGTLISIILVIWSKTKEGKKG